METLLVLAEKYGLAVFVCGLIGSILVGCIKTPMRYSVNKKLNSLEKTDPKVTKTATVMDIVTYFISTVVAVLVTAAYLLLFKQFTWRGLLSVCMAVWPTQTAVYNVWKKLGLKKVLLLVWEEFKKAIVKAVDKDKNGTVELHEAVEDVQELTDGGKINQEKLVEMAKEAAPVLVEDILKSVDAEASKIEDDPEPEQIIGEKIAGMIKKKTEAAEAAKKSESVSDAKDVVEEASEAPQVTSETPAKVGHISIIKL